MKREVNQDVINNHEVLDMSVESRSSVELNVPNLFKK